VVAEFDERVVEVVDAGAVPGWDATPPEASVVFGTEWARRERSVVLRVPSVMIPSESNFVLNPEHPDFSRSVRIAETRSFAFDRRLLQRR
jgi:RES domain-containing protein